jgi:Flp pilus assembly protein TadG
MRFLRAPKQLRADKRGIAAVEFAVIAPVFLVVLMGGMDFGHTLYTQAVLQGAVQKAARDSALEDGGSPTRQAAVDAVVREQALTLMNTADVQITRRGYRSFSQAAAAQAETWTDSDGNGTCNGGEVYSDANLNGQWDRDGSAASQGGAKDVTVYTVTMTYPRLFPTNTLIGFPANTTIQAQTVLQNQPYADQANPVPIARNCA